MASPRPWVVLKFGGTSVSSLSTWTQILARCRELLPAHRVWVVVSAVSGVTNALLASLEEAVATPSGNGALPSSAPPPPPPQASFTWVSAAHARLSAELGLTPDEFAPAGVLLAELKRLLDGIALTGEVSPKLRARVAAYGELLSSTLGAAFLARSSGASARVTLVDSRTLLTSRGSGGPDAATGGGVVAEADAYLEADVKPSQQVDRADAAAKGGDIVICQGFIASTPSGATCLLGRGGSDTSGALFASLCGAVRLEIWTDVNGMFTADPRVVPRARLIRSLTYREAQELAAMGAKVLHPRCLLPAASSGYNVEVRNTMDPSDSAEITVVSSHGLDYLATAAAVRGRGLASAEASAGSGAAAQPLVPPEGSGGAAAFPRALAIVAAGGARAPSPSIVPSSKIVFSSEADHPDGALGKLSLEAHGGSQSGASSDSESSPFPARPRSPFGPPSPSSAGGSGGVGAGNGEAKVLAVARRKGVTLMTLSAYDMWGNAGFLSKVFAPFAAQGVSVDLIATSSYAVSVTLDHVPEGVRGEPFARLNAALSRVCTVTARYPCAVVSVVGRSLRNALPALGVAMGALAGVPVHMVSEAAEDLNMSFVIDEEHADKLVMDLHKALLEGHDVANDPQFGPPWVEMQAAAAAAAAAAKAAPPATATA